MKHGNETRTLDDPGLAARVRVGDPEVVEAIVHAFLPQVLRAARGAGLDPQQAEDVTQATFFTFVQTAAHFEGRSQVRTWLFGILYKKIAESRRRTRREQDMQDLDSVLENRFDARGSWTRPPRPADERAYAAEVREGIESCLESISTPQRMAFVLREIEGLETQEICKILEVSRTNLGVLLYRARNGLRECLEAKGMKE
jgi:RNA polymerase sigma-70 factor (ECF subfamily)